MRKLLVVVGLLALLLFSLPLVAQDNPKAEVFGGYQYTYLGGDLTGINTNGWDASVTANINKHFGISGDFSGVYKTLSASQSGTSASVKAHLYTYAFGPVVAYDFGGKINPFVHFLVGGFTLGGTGCLNNSDSSNCASGSTNGFAMKFGGGVDVKVNRAIAIRLAQFDWDYFHANGTGESKNVSLATGIVIRF